MFQGAIRVPDMSTSQAGPLLWFGVVTVAALSIFPIAGLAQAPQNGASAPNTIVIKQMRFNPPTQTVRIGAAIEWKNEDIFAHTVTADDGSFDSGVLQPNQSFTQTFKKAGTFGYHDLLDSAVKGTITVK
jgi:plastocyanin